MKRMLILLLEYYLVLSLMALVTKGDQLASHHHTSIGGRSHVYSGRSSIATFSFHGVLKVPVPVASPNYAPSTSPVHKIHHHSPHLSKLLLKRNQSPSSGSNLFPSNSLAPSPANSYATTIPASLGQPPLSPDLSECCKENMVPKRGNEMCHCVYPIKLELLLLNVTLSSNWSSEFLTELASQLSLHVTQFEITNFYVVGLSRLNITMDIAPHTGISFSASDASEMNLSLSMHKVHLDSSLGDYRLLNFTWYKLPPPTPAPIAHSSPAPASSSHPNMKVSTPGSNVNHSSLIIILCIGGAILMVVIISVLIIYSCMKKRGKKEVIVSKEPGIPSTFTWMLYDALLVPTICRWSSSVFLAVAATIMFRI